jgi:hypothetical protein
MRELATVRRFNFGNGYGFVKTDAGDTDVFLFTPDQLRANGRRGGLAYVANHSVEQRRAYTSRAALARCRRIREQQEQSGF